MTVYLLSGAPGSGKSSIADALLQRFPFGLHIPVDDLREWVVSGISHPVPTWTEETTRQFRLARCSAATIARLYAEDGFAVVIDDVIFPNDTADTFDSILKDIPYQKILLLPDVETALERNATRTHKAFDTSLLIEPIKSIHRAMREADFGARGWRILDNTHLTIPETAMCILEK